MKTGTNFMQESEATERHLDSLKESIEKGGLKYDKIYRTLKTMDVSEAFNYLVRLEMEGIIDFYQGMQILHSHYKL